MGLELGLGSGLDDEVARLRRDRLLLDDACGVGVERIERVVPQPLLPAPQVRGKAHAVEIAHELLVRVRVRVRVRVYG